MSLDINIKTRIAKNAFLSLFIYALPILLLWGYLSYTKEKPWTNTTKAYFGQIEKYKKK